MRGREAAHLQTCVLRAGSWLVMFDALRCAVVERVRVRIWRFVFEGQLKTEGGCRGFRTGRSIPVIELCNLNVGSVAMISTIAAPAPPARCSHTRMTVKLKSNFAYSKWRHQTDMGHSRDHDIGSVCHFHGSRFDLADRGVSSFVRQTSAFSKLHIG